MYRITLIATGHREHGICNSNELYKIIERIAPEIIFEEFSPDLFAAIYEGSRPDTLETDTIKRYLQKHRIAHFPVDLDANELIGKRFWNDIKKMFNTFDQYPEIQYLSNQHEVLSEQLGFPYLNSDRCRELLERKHCLEKDIVRMFNHEKFSQTYKGWLEIHDRRENEMIKNIYSYSKLNKYNRALFLVGAEHRKTIIDRIPIFEKNNRLGLNWFFDFFN